MPNTLNTNKKTKRVSFLVSTFLFFYNVIFSQYSVALGAAQEQKSSSNYILPQTLQLPKSSDMAGKSQWIQLVSRPGNDKEYFAVNQNGQIHLFEQGNEQNSRLVLDLNSFDEHSQDAFLLNAFTLHPNFAVKDAQGYRTFYTAHTEKSNKAIETLRIESSKVEQDLDFEAVVTEWQLIHEAKAKIDLSTKREVARIPVAIIEESVTQISFHPYLKSWDDDFGLLYISLSSTNSLINLPLYSGVILRIDPKQFGLRSYTVPNTNPFLSYISVHDSIFLLGAQKIQQFIWPNKYNKQLLISHHFHNKQLKNAKTEQFLTLTSGGEDWRDDPSYKTIFQGNNLLNRNSLLTYKGRNAAVLRNRIVILQHNQLYSLPFNTLLAENEQEYKLVELEHEWEFSNDFSKSKKILMFQNTDNDLLFLKTNLGSVYQLSQSEKVDIITQNPESNVLFYTIGFLILVGTVLLVVYSLSVKKKSVKSLVRKQYSRLTFNDKLRTINLYKRHQKQSSRTIELSNIISCDIILGDLVIYTLDNINNKSTFCDNKEQELRDIFQREQTDKMIDGKVRKISLCINERSKMSAIVCLYLRKGNDRITKKTYFVVVDELIDWCWLITQKGSNKKTSARSNIQKDSEKISSQSLHQQTEDIYSATHSESLKTEVSFTQENDPTLYTAEAIRAANTLSTNEQTKKVERNNKNRKNADSDIIDIELVNTLEKLVQLKQQGFLSLEEFTQAKAKLLNNLIDS